MGEAREEKPESLPDLQTHNVEGWQVKRQKISKRTRFEVFKRDSFTCQYCGRQAPDVILEIDHITPVKKGGDSNIFNLITSCGDCNAGKSCVPLSKRQELEKQKEQLNQLQERRTQIEMMSKWRIGLIQQNQAEVDSLIKLFTSLTGYTLTAVAKCRLGNWIRRFGFNETLKAMETSVQWYGGSMSQIEVRKVVDKIPHVHFIRQENLRNPTGSKIRYIVGILRNRLSYFPWKAQGYMEQLAQSGVPVEKMQEIAIQITSWKQFEESTRALIPDKQP